MKTGDKLYQIYFKDIIEWEITVIVKVEICGYKYNFYHISKPGTNIGKMIEDNRIGYDYFSSWKEAKEEIEARVAVKEAKS